MKGAITFTMIKPDAVRNNFIGQIITAITEGGFTIKAMKFTQLNKQQAQAFYAVHKERPFYNDLVEFMTSGPIVAMLLKKSNAITQVKAWTLIILSVQHHIGVKLITCLSFRFLNCSSTLFLLL